VQDAELIIHNAPFDLGFLDMEFLRGLPPFREHAGNVIDTLREARQMFPGKRNSLDALCDRLGVSNAHRTLHGALLDAELLAEVYLAMTRGQNSLVIDMLDGATTDGETAPPTCPP
jgi:DNA polymerase-3 subunit epsilon